MDSSSIDSIIQQKYGGGQENDHGKENSDQESKIIKGVDYLQKIGQLPLHIPVWKASDISEAIEKIVRKGVAGSEKLAEEFIKNKALIVEAIESNPRQVKRFINNVILAQSIFGKPIDELIVIQALDFRPEWKKFLDLITPDKVRTTFFSHENGFYQSYLDGKIKSKEDAEKSIKEKMHAQDIASVSNILIETFQELITHSDTLGGFLKVGGDKILLKIKNMAEHRKALEAMKVQEARVQEENKTMLEMLKAGKVAEFNKRRIMLTNQAGFQFYDFLSASLKDAYLSGANLSHADLSKADLSKADLSKTNLSHADLSKANLSKADLSKADLSKANLTGANLTGANLLNASLFGAILFEVNLSEADLSKADLSHADLSNTFLLKANLSEADLSNTFLLKADLTGANLTGANLLSAGLFGAELTRANLSEADLSNSIIIGLAGFSLNLLCTDANFDGAVIDDEKLLNHLHNYNAKKLPSAIKDKNELRNRLQKTGLKQEKIDHLLLYSQL